MIRRYTSNIHTFPWVLSTILAQIRFMEYLLHTGYRLDVNKWQYRNSEEKRCIAKNKNKQKIYIIQRFESQARLLLDTPKQERGKSMIEIIQEDFLKMLL